MSFLKHITKNVTPYTLAVLVIVSVLAVAIVKYQKQAVTSSQRIKVQVVGQGWTDNFNQYSGYRPPYWLVRDISVGDKQYSQDGRTIAEIVDLEIYDRDGGNKEVFLILDIETVDNLRARQKFFNGGIVETGAPIELHLASARLYGQITDANYPKEGYPKKVVRLLISADGVKSGIVDDITPGLKIEQTNQTTPLAEIVAVRSMPTTSLTLASGSIVGEVVRFQRDATLQTVQLEVAVVAEEIADTLYFSGHQVLRVGSPLWLFFPTVDLRNYLIEEIKSVEAL